MLESGSLAESLKVVYGETQVHFQLKWTVCTPRRLPLPEPSSRSNPLHGHVFFRTLLYHLWPLNLGFDATFTASLETCVVPCHITVWMSVFGQCSLLDWKLLQGRDAACLIITFVVPSVVPNSLAQPAHTLDEATLNLGCGDSREGMDITRTTDSWAQHWRKPSLCRKWNSGGGGWGGEDGDL